MYTDNFDKIIQTWESTLKEINELYNEGQERFLKSTKSYFESMKYFAELSGNVALTNLYKTLIDATNKIIEKFLETANKK
ncbi:MAG TPA: hypothetical protein PKW55_03640 [Spirochaetota bacterium]|nr:hypothetical protein [Spirochaetota bacterium]HOM38073.1 hypothetical protein [Spirochaetota bacterium]HPQ48876.1 hypothetical protein [Spirochaetota bacterium]